MTPEARRARGAGYARKWYANNPEKAAASRLKSRYGISAADLAEMRERQQGKCAGCRRDGVLLGVDHCHATGRVRGLLCRPCNTFLGVVKDDPALLRGLAAYLEAAN